VFVGDRGNSRIQIFDQDGTFLAEWRQFGRPSGIFIDRHDAIYVTDSESSANRNPEYQRGLRVGSARDGWVRAFVPMVSANPAAAARPGRDSGGCERNDLRRRDRRTGHQAVLEEMVGSWALGVGS
jgi:hypothetical protein